MRPSLASLPLALLAASCGAPDVLPEESVRPGVNETFLDPEMDLAHYLEVFEGEAREIAASRAEIVARLELRAGMQVADVGSGTGLFLAPLARGVGADGRVFALDIAPRFVEHLARRAREEGLENVVAQLCAEDSIGLGRGTIDLALVCDTYHHFEYPRSTLESIRRALRPDGRLVVIDFERVPGVSRAWVLDHVRADKATFSAEIEAAGFELVDEPEVPGLVENYLLRFRRR